MRPITLSFAALLATSAAAQEMPLVYSGEFPRLDFETVMPTGQSVAKDCQDEAAGHPYAPYDWPDAAATLEIRQGGGESRVTVAVENARPGTLYTMWVRLRGEGADGAPFGGNPLIAIPGKPDLGIPGNGLVPSHAMLDALAAITEPVTDPINGFWTDAEGNGSVTIELDYPIVGGAVPFHRAGFDPSDERLTLNGPRAIPVAIVGETARAPFTLRLASHCIDGLSHGLAPGPHEGWFDWTAPI